MNHNGRPLTMRKKVQLVLALTILAWATQTLFAQWARGEEITFVPQSRGAGAVPGGTLELRAEARVVGGEAKLKQICRWSDDDAATFAPVADVVLVKLEPRRPYKIVSVQDIREMLEDAGINVARVRFSGPLECTVSRSDVALKEGEALEQWIKTQEDADAGAEPAAAKLATDAAESKPADGAEETGLRTLRKLLVADLSVRLAVPEEQLVLSFDPRDESVLNLPESSFKFNVRPRQIRDLGEVSWEVTIVSPSAGSRKAQIRATARAWQEQLVAARPVARKQTIQSADVTSRRTLADKLPEAALLKDEQVVGQMAARDLKPGTIMTASLVEAVPLAKVGQFITVTLDRGNVRVKSVAKALEGGCYGQTIRVKNQATKDVYQVILTGPQEATMASAAIEEKSVASASVEPR